MTLLIITLLIAAAQLIIQAAFIMALLQAISLILFAIEGELCEFLDWLSELFEMVAGIRDITYDGKQTLFINVFFSNDSIMTIYWGMALIGIAMTLGFAIFSVVKKVFDAHDKHETTYSVILGNVLKSVLLILGMNVIISAILSGTNVLLDQMNYLWSHADEIELSATITYDDEDFALMARTYNTIAQYSMNPTYDSRYNINSCYNAIRKDLKRLQDKERFQFSIRTLDAYGNEVDTWQSVLQDIVQSYDVSQDADIDTYNEAMYDSILYAMDILKSDSSTFQPLQSYTYTKPKTSTVQTYSLGRLVMLMGSLNCAYNSYYNQNASIDDALRGPFARGEKDIYSEGEAIKYFNLSIFGWNHIYVIVLVWVFLKQYLAMIFTAVSRTVNLIFLYLIAPPIISVTPLDNGKKIQQWFSAIVLQSFSLFGSVLAMRLFNIFIPIILEGKFQFFASSSSNMWAKFLVILGLSFVVRKASGLVTGILANNAGMAAITAGDMSSNAEATAGMAKKYVIMASKKVGGAVLGTLLGAAKKTSKDSKTNGGIRDIGQSVKQGLKSSWGGLKPGG